MSISAAGTTSAFIPPKTRTSTISSLTMRGPTIAPSTRCSSPTKSSNRQFLQVRAPKSKWKWTCPCQPTSNTRSSSKIEPLPRRKKSKRMWKGRKRADQLRVRDRVSQHRPMEQLRVPKTSNPRNNPPLNRLKFRLKAKAQLMQVLKTYRKWAVLKWQDRTTRQQMLPLQLKAQEQPHRQVKARQISKREC